MSNFQSLFNWADIAIVVFLIIGFFRGRKNGLSQELIPLFQWFVIVFGCAFGYEPLGNFLMSFTTMFSLLFAFIVSYLLIAVVVKIFFALIKKSLGGKLLGSSIFGNAEYPLGIVSGILRFACMIIFAMALLNAKLVPAAQARATIESQLKLYDKDYFSGARIEIIQSAVFEESHIGKFVKENMTLMLIKPTEAAAKELHQKEYDSPY